MTRISGFVATMKLPHPLQIYSAVLVKKCIWLHFQGIVQQQTTGKAGNSITFLWANNLCLQQ